MCQRLCTTRASELSHSGHIRLAAASGSRHIKELLLRLHLQQLMLKLLHTELLQHLLLLLVQTLQLRPYLLQPLQQKLLLIH